MVKKLSPPFYLLSYYFEPLRPHLPAASNLKRSPSYDRILIRGTGAQFVTESTAPSSICSTVGTRKSCINRNSVHGFPVFLLKIRTIPVKGTWIRNFHKPLLSSS